MSKYLLTSHIVFEVTACFDDCAKPGRHLAPRKVLNKAANILCITYKIVVDANTIEAKSFKL